MFVFLHQCTATVRMFPVENTINDLSGMKACYSITNAQRTLCTCCMTNMHRTIRSFGSTMFLKKYKVICTRIRALHMYATTVMHAITGMARPSDWTPIPSYAVFLGMVYIDIVRAFQEFVFKKEYEEDEKCISFTLPSWFHSVEYAEHGSVYDNVERVLMRSMQ